MRINVSRVINSHCTDSVTLLRSTQIGDFINGVWVSGKADADFIFQGSVQPFEFEDFKSLPEGIRDNEAVWVYTRTVLNGSNSENSGDYLIWRGAKWKVVKCEHWEHGGYIRAAAIKIREEPTP